MPVTKLAWIILFGALVGSPLFATSTSVLQTKSKLQQLLAHIKSLKLTLASDQGKRGALNQELADIEKQIGTGVQKLRSLQNTINIKEQKIAQLQDTIIQLNQQLSTQQHLLAKHVRARYQMGEYQVLKWLIDQNEPYRVSRLVTYYQYLVQSRQRLIQSIDDTRKRLKTNKKTLNQELAETKQLKGQLLQHQQQLVAHKQHQGTVIHSLNNEIETNRRSLYDAERDRDNLSKLLHSLAERSVSQPNQTFAQLRKKLPRPVHVTSQSLRKMNQGLTFFAEEGTPVSAVYPGKIVFSDWLKGYGLLLIVDHGQGFMTLYAHNQALFKQKGEEVAQNEHIANVGHSGGIKENGLYFEVRVKGKAVSPLDWLA